jgi:hypothetical protein
MTARYESARLGQRAGSVPCRAVITRRSARSCSEQRDSGFPHTGSRAADDLPEIEVRGRGSAGSYPDTLASRETSERNLFHRSFAQTMREAGVVNDLAMTDVDSVVQMAPARHDEARTQRRFLVTPHASRRPARAR